MDFVWVIWVVWSIHIERLTIQYFVKISVSKRVFQVLVLPHPKGVMVMIEIEDADVFKLLYWRRLVSAGRLHHLALKVIYLTTHQPHHQCNAMQGNSRDQSPVCTEGYFSQRPKATLFFFRIHSFTKSLSSSHWYGSPMRRSVHKETQFASRLGGQVVIKSLWTGHTTQAPHCPPAKSKPT